MIEKAKRTAKKITMSILENNIVPGDKLYKEKLKEYIEINFCGNEKEIRKFIFLVDSELQTHYNK